MPSPYIHDFTKLWCYVKTKDESISGIWNFTNGIKIGDCNVLTDCDLNLDNVVYTTDIDQSINGNKSFLKPLVVPDAVSETQAVNLGQLNAAIPPAGNYIDNQTASSQSASYWISGNGIIDTSLTVGSPLSNPFPYAIGTHYKPLSSILGTLVASSNQVGAPNGADVNAIYFASYNEAGTVSSSGTYSTLNGVGASIIIRGSAIVNVSNGFIAKSPQSFNIGSIPNASGFYIEPQFVTDLTTKGWGINQVGTQDVNYFAGIVGIGTSTPSSTFQVDQSSTGIGAVSVTNDSGTVIGINTTFLNTFRIGDTITVDGETRTISAIASNISMTTNNWAHTSYMSFPSSITVVGQSSGGIIGPGTLYYVMTSINGAGETIKSAEFPVTTTGSTNSIHITWTPRAGATSYRIYKGTVSGTYTSYFNTTNYQNFVDTGTSGTAGTPPVSNTAVGYTGYSLVGGTTAKFFGNGNVNFPRLIVGTPQYNVLINSSGNLIIGAVPVGIVGSYVPYTGATGDVNLGAHYILSTAPTSYYSTNGLSGASLKLATLGYDIGGGVPAVELFSGVNHSSYRYNQIYYSDGTRTLTITEPTLTGNRAILWPDNSGTIALTSDLSSYQTTSNLETTITNSNILYPSGGAVISYVTGLGYITGNQTITLSGAVTGSGSTAITTSLATSVVGISNLSATGTPSSTTYLRGDNTWVAIINGTGFVKATGTTISYDNSTYLTTSSAASTYLPLVGGSMTGAGDVIFPTTGNRGVVFDSSFIRDNFFSMTGWAVQGSSTLVDQSFYKTDSTQYINRFDRTSPSWYWSTFAAGTHWADITSTGVYSLGNKVVTVADFPTTAIPYSDASAVLTSNVNKLSIDVVGRQMSVLGDGQTFSGLFKIGNQTWLGGYNQFTVEENSVDVDDTLNGHNGINSLALFRLTSNQTHRIRSGNFTVKTDLNGFDSNLISSGFAGVECVSRFITSGGTVNVATGCYGRVLIDITGVTLNMSNAYMAHAPGNVAGGVMNCATGYHVTDQNTGPNSASVLSSANIISGGNNTSDSGQKPSDGMTGFWNFYGWSQLPNYWNGLSGFGVGIATANVKAWNHIAAGSTTVPSMILNSGVALTVGIDGALTYDGTNFLGYVSTVKNTFATDVNTLTFTNKTWNGGVISGTYGGTGVNNGVKTITLAQNLNLVGGFNMTLNTTGSTNITLPTSGTLSTLAGTENLTNKTVNKVTLTAPATAATITITNNKTLAVTNTLTFSGTDATVLTGPNTSGSLVVGGTITWPGTLYTTPTTGTVSAAGVLNLSPALATQTANMVLAGPTTGSAATPTFRALVAADLPTSAQPIHGNSTTTGTATTVVTVTIGSTLANNTYVVSITPRDLLTAVNYYISAQSTTQFTITFVTALTGSINFDWIVNQ